MPKLPDKFDLGQPGSQSRSLALAPDNWPDESGLQVAASAVKAIGNISATLEAKQQEADDYEVQKAIVDFDLEQEKRLDDAKRSAAPEARGFTDGYRSGYDEGATKLMARIPDRLKPKVDEMLVKRGASFEKRAYDFELAERDRWNIQDVNKNTSDLVTRTMSNPDTLEDNAGRGVALIRSSRLSQRAKVETERKFLDMNAEYGIKALIDREIEAGRDAGDLIERLRKVPKGSAPSATAGDGVDLTSVLTSGKGKAAAAGWARSNETWAGLNPWQKAAAMALMEADGRDPVAAKNALGAMINRAAKGGEDLGEHVSQAIYQPTIEPTQAKRLGSIVQSAEFQKLTQWAQDRVAGKEADPVNGATHFLAHERTMEALRAREPNKYKSWVGWSGYDRGGGKYTNPDGSEVVRDNSHAFLAPEGRYEARATLIKGDDTVERKDLPAPGDAATPVLDKKEAQAPTVDADGRPVLTKNDASTADVPQTGPEAGTPSDDLVESDQPGWAYLTPATRRKLIGYARTAGRAVVAKGVDDDIARLRLGREPELGPDGTTSIDRAKAHMTNMQWVKKKQEWDEAKLEHRELSGLRMMPDGEAADYIASIVDRAESEGLSAASAARIQKKADQRLTKMIEMRNKDPVRAITGSIGDDVDDRSPPLPNTMAALKRISEARQGDVLTGPDGTPIKSPTSRPVLTPQQQWETLFEGRLADQAEVMPYETEKHRILSKREAEGLLMMPKDGKGLEPRAYRAKLEEAAKRAEAKFGPKYAKRALEEAIGFHLAGGSADQKSRQASIIAKMARGEAVSSADVRELRNIEQVDNVSLSAGMDAMSRFDRTGRPPGMPQMVPMGDAGRPAIGQPVPTPNDKQIEWLRANPDGWQTFDQRFGAGASARVLGAQGGDAWGDKRGKVPKRDWREDETGVNPKSGWSGFFGR